MISPNTEFPGQSSTPNTDYPLGGAQNITTPGDNTGTPWIAKVVNDWYGFFQFWQSKSEFAVNDVPDTARISQQAGMLASVIGMKKVGLNVSATTGTVGSITPGSILDSTGQRVLVRPPSSGVFTKNIALTWLAGSGNGGLASSLSLTADTWYHFFLLQNTNGDTIEAGFDTSVTATNLLADAAVQAANLTVFKRISSHMTDGGSVFLEVEEMNLGGESRFIYAEMINDVLESPTNTQEKIRVVSTPLGIQTLGNFVVGVANVDTGFYLFTEVSQTNVLPSATSDSDIVTETGGASTQGRANLSLRTNTASEIRYRVSTSANAGVTISTKSYIDTFED